MRTSLHASVFGVTGIEAAIEAAAAADVSVIELPVGESGILSLDVTEEACVAWKHLAEAKGVTISALTFADPSDTDLGVEDDALRDAASNRVMAALDRAQWLGADMVVVSPGIVMGSKTDGVRRELLVRYENVHTRSLESLLALRFEAGLRGIRIACRCGGGGFLLSPIEARDFLDRINSPWVLASLDPDNLRRLGSPADWILTMARRLGHVFVRLSEQPEETHQDTAEHAAIWDAFSRIRYSGVLACAGPGTASELATRIGELLQSASEDAESE